jgi:hypothetical protein
MANPIIRYIIAGRGSFAFDEFNAHKISLNGE